MTKILKSFLLAASITLVGGGLASSALAAGNTDADKAIAAAKDAYQQALAVGGAWRDTGKMILQAEKLLEDGKMDEAAKVAAEAEAQAMLGHIQATTQSLDALHVN